METLKYAKGTKRKKKKRHKQSILHKKDGTCYLCIKLHDDYGIKYTEEHHIFGGPNRSISEAEGLKVFLCLEHHREGPEAVHKNAKVSRLLQQDAQEIFEKTGSREHFMKLIGKNYR